MKRHLLSLAIASSLSVPVFAATELVTSFENPPYASGEPEYLEITPQGGSATIIDYVQQHASDGSNAMLASFAAELEPVLIWNWGTWDWSSHDNIYVDVTNPGTSDAVVAFKVIDQDIATGCWCDESHATIQYYTVAAGESTTLAMSLNGGHEDQTHGENFDKNKALGVQVLLGEAGAADLYFDNLRVGTISSEPTPPEVPEAANQVHSAPVKTLALLEGFDGDELAEYIVPDQGLSVNVVDKGVSQGAKALEVVYPAGGWGSLVFNPNPAWNADELGDNLAIAIDVTNPADQSIELFTRLQSDGGVSGDINNRAARILAGKQTRTIYVSLNDNPPWDMNEWDQNGRVAALGMRDLPASPARDAWGQDFELNSANITELRFFLAQPAADTTLIFDNLRVIKDLNHSSAFAGLLDAKGQNSQVTYKYKVADQTELSDLGSAETANGVLGRLQGAARAANGFGHPSLQPNQSCVMASPASFNACKDTNGKWHLVDADGNAFFSTGVANIRLADTYTMTGSATEGDSSALRQAMFTEVPTTYENANYGPVHSGPVSRGQAVSFYGHNLVQRYGSEQAWRSNTLNRMKDWGFTTLGNWTAPAFYAETDMPFVANGWTRNCRGCEPVNTIGDGYWGGLPDPWDEAFASNAAAMAAQIKAELSGADMSKLVGIYVDNELSWGSPTAGPQELNSNQKKHIQTIAVFNTDAELSPAKSAFLNIIQADWGLNYATIEQLNRAWGTSFASFDAMRPALELGYDGEHAQMTADLNTLQWFYAFQYFTVVKNALNAELPGHLYLGSRFADWGRTDRVVDAAAAVVDVLSYNIYKQSVSADDWDGDALGQLADLDKPAIIGEFHMGSLDNGSFAEGLITATSQAQRAEMMVNYLETVNDNPQFVGAHWFQYIDSPIVGRAWDGENYNVGFVTVTDTPYTEMTDAIRIFNCYMYDASLKDQCETELTAPNSDSRARSSSLYSGNNVGVLHRGPEAADPSEPQEPTDPEEPTEPEEPTNPEEPPTGRVINGGSSGILLIAGLLGLALIRRRVH